MTSHSSHAFSRRGANQPFLRHGARLMGACILLSLLLLVFFAEGAAAASTLYVDENHPNCSNKGSGSSDQPFCTVAAATLKVTAGTTVRVSAGNYDEQVSPKSGTASAPVTYEAAPGDTVTVRGGQYGFYLSNKSWVTVQGFKVTDTASNGIHVSSGAKNIKVAGNNVSFAGQIGSNSKAKGISITDATDVQVRDNTVERNTDYGIYLQKSSRALVTGNEVRDNARQYERAASGIRLYNSSDSTVSSNVSHDNEDSGVELTSTSTNNLVVNNSTHDNGDHGVDILGSTGGRVVANSVYGNLTAGINAEGSSSGTTFANNVSVENGVNSPRTRGNLRVDSSSTLGSTINHDLVHLSAPGTMVVWGNGAYSSLSAMQSMTGQEPNGLEADPRWKDVATRDFHLGADSPAIDSANSAASGQSATDIEGNARVDAHSVSNTGAGPRAFDDRGAYELQPEPAPPVAGLSVTPPTGTVDLDVTADASASTDPDGQVTSYRFDFGDGSPAVGPQTEATADHTYTTAGTYTVTVTVTDDSGRSSTATSQVTVEDLAPTARLSVAPDSGNAPHEVTADASASTDPDDTPIESYSFDFGDGSPATGPQSGATATHTYEETGTYTVTVTVADEAGQTSSETHEVRVFGANSPPDPALSVTPGSGSVNLDVTADASASTDPDGEVESYSFDFGDGSPAVGPQGEASAEHTYEAAGTYTVTVTVTDDGGESSSATSQVLVEDVPPTARLSVSPRSGMAPHEVTADASASTDPDDTPIESYSFDFGDGSSTVGPQSAATATHTYAAPGTYTVTVTAKDEAEQTAQTTERVTVRANLIGNPGFESDLSGWNISGGSSTVSLTRSAGGHSGNWAAKLTNPGTSTATCTLNDSPNWVRTTSAGGYHASFWVRSDTPGSLLKLRLREYNGSTLAGSQTTEEVLTTSWRRVTVEHSTVSPGSTLDLNAYVSGASPGTCFYADDASLDLIP